MTDVGKKDNIQNSVKVYDGTSRVERGEVRQVVQSYTQHAQAIAVFMSEFICPNEKRKKESIDQKLEEIQKENNDLNNKTQIDALKEQLARFKYGSKKYMNALQNISNGFLDTLNFDLQDYYDYLSESGQDNEEIFMGQGKMQSVGELFTRNTLRSIKIVTEAAEALRRESCASNEHGIPLPIGAAVCANEGATSGLLPHQYAPFEVNLIPPLNYHSSGIRDVGDSSCGTLMKLDVLVAKVESAKPHMKVARYVCCACAASAFQPVELDTFLPQRKCHSSECANRVSKNVSDLELIKRESKLISREVIIVQEPQHLTPPGCVPRRLPIVLQGSLCGTVKPGNSITVSGVPFSKEYGGFQGLMKGPVREVEFLAQHITIHKSAAALDDDAQEYLKEKVKALRQRPDWYPYLANSLCPSIFGHDDVKKALLLQLVSAPTLTTEAGFSVRGEIHVLLMGDPGVAKSQMLSKVVRVAPRGTYTTGKGASGVGLTAAVTKDPSTGEFTLESGAIVLADRGICCIDEFDKMDDGDRTSIHEVMEQQTVSISKAGLNMQLNARTAILAAANPVYGRYDLTKSVIENMRLPYSLVSRFDLSFVLLDTVDREQDWNLSKYILKVHALDADKNDDIPEDEYMDSTTIRYTLSLAQMLEPEIPVAVGNEIKERYSELRAAERLVRQTGGSEDTYTTPRTLFTIIRLSQALARIYFREFVTMEDVEEACRLMEASRDSLKRVSKSAALKKKQGDIGTRIIDLIRSCDKRKMGGNYPWLPMADLSVQAQTNGFSLAQLQKTVKEYVSLGVLQYENDEKTAVAFVERLEIR